MMKHVLIAALVAAQLSTTPAFAASLEDYSGVSRSRGGAFAGARVRIGFGGKDHGKARAGLTLAPMTGSLSAQGVRTRFGEGVELSVVSDQPLALRIGGVPLNNRLAAAQDDQERDGKDSTGTKILKGVAVAAIVGAAVVGGLILFVVVACDGNRCSE